MSRFPTVSEVAAGYDAADGGAPRVCKGMEDDCEPWGNREVKSVFDLFRLGVEANPQGRCMGYRPFVNGEAADYRWHTYAEVDDAIARLSTALSDTLGLSAGQRVGILGKNCPNWVVTQIAVSAAGMVLVPLYDTLAPRAMKYIAAHSELEVIFISEDKVQSFVDVWPELPSVKTLVVFGQCGFSELLKPKEISSINDERIRKFGDVLSVEPAPISHVPKHDDFFIIMYTSGTTGDPKGVLLNNRSIVSSVAVGRTFNSYWRQDFEPDDVFFSYLPLAHILAQQMEVTILSVGAAIGYYQGNVKLLLSDIEALKPTLFAGVPRVYARFEQKIREALDSASLIKKMLFNYALNSQLHNVRNGIPRNWLWDKLLFDKIKAKILPTVRIAVTGGAPMSEDTNDFLKVCLNLPLIQGYGMTETVGGVSCSAPNRSRSGTCGGPFAKTQIKLVDVPEMNYFVTDKPRPRGEIFVKGETVMKGYYKNEEETRKAFPHGDDWLATGDIGTWNTDGTLQIIDRRKNLFKLSQGEYVSPEQLEQEYAKAKLIGQIFVYGTSLESSLIAVVVPDVDAAEEWGAKNGNLTKLDEIVKKPSFKSEVLDQIEQMRIQSNFHKYEAVKDVIFEVQGLNDLGQGFNVDNNLMTPTFKLKRVQLVEKYKPALDITYSNLKTG